MVEMLLVGKMNRFRFLLFLIIIIINTSVSGQVKIRLFSLQNPETVVFFITDGKYELDPGVGEKLIVNKGEPVVILHYRGRLAVKFSKSPGFVCDSVLISGKTGNDFFSLRCNTAGTVKQFYTGDLKIYPDLGSLAIINNCDIEKYIAGVVRAEGGSGKNAEYFKTQAIIARTYMYKYMDKHITDGYNVCDNTHCQAYNGLSMDTIINLAAKRTKDQVILAPDSTLIISAFHSNCGGETSTSEDVWLSSQTYLKKVIDPYCNTSRNAIWEKKIGLSVWLDFLKKSGYTGKSDDVSAFTFYQNARLDFYNTGSFKVPLRDIRREFNLRSTFFSVIPEGETIILRGRGYGHGVGLCQEGAMEMASRGFNYTQIIDFYYLDVHIADIKNAKVIPGS